MYFNNMMLAGYVGSEMDIENTLIWKIIIRPLLILMIPAFIIQLFTDFLIDIWESLYIFNLVTLAISTIGILFFNYLFSKESKKNQIESKNEEKQSRKEKYPSSQKEGKYAKYVLLLFVISSLVGYALSSVWWESILSDYFFDLQMANDNPFASLFYLFMFLLFIILDEIIKLLIIPIVQLILLFISTGILNRKQGKLA